MVTLPGKPLARSGKGSIQRKASIKLYEQEIAQLYARNDEGVDVSTPPPGSSNGSNTVSSVRQFLQDFLQETLGQVPSDGEDLFRLGLDSLHVLQLSRELTSFIGKGRIDPKIIYKNNSIEKLVAHFQSDETSPTLRSREDILTEVLKRFTVGLPFNARSPESTEGCTVFLTGSTGSLGSYILDELIRQPRVTKVICANRRSYSRRRQASLHATRGLSTNLAKAEFLTVDLSSQWFGLSHEKYWDLLQEVTHVLHNAWTVDFNIGFESFVDVHVTGVRQLIDFCAMSKYGAKFSFASSIGTVQGLQSTSETEVPEVIFDDWKVSASTGYSEAKHVCERLLDAACRISDISVDILRIGQIAGPVQHGTFGQWNTQEWLPSILQSSLALGRVPQDLGPMDMVDWMPVDIMASAIVELLVQGSGPSSLNGIPANNTPAEARVYHIVNPSAISWSDLLPSILAQTPTIQPIPFDDWVDCLRTATESSTDLELTEKIPAGKILDFFKQWQADARQLGTFRKLSTTHTSIASKIIDSMKPVNSDWMDLWLKQWDFSP
jgi:thioester reductase-like protein/aryl carrier-like protein